MTLYEPSYTDVTTRYILSTGSDVTGSDITKNDVTGSDITKNDVTGSDITKNDVTGSDNTKNDVTGSDITKNDVTGSDITKNDVTGSEESAATSINEMLLYSSSDSTSLVYHSISSSVELTLCNPESQSGSLLQNITITYHILGKLLGLFILIEIDCGIGIGNHCYKQNRIPFKAERDLDLGHDF